MYMVTLKTAIIGGIGAAVISGTGFVGANFYQAKKEQVQHWADNRYVSQNAYAKTENRKEIRRIKNEIFELQRLGEQRTLTDVEKRHLNDLKIQLQELE